MHTDKIGCHQASLFWQACAGKSRVCTAHGSFRNSSGSVKVIPVTMFVQAVCHKWPWSFALDACTRLALNYMDDVSLTEEVLLEPAKVALMLERGPVDTPSHQEGEDRGSRATSSHQQGTHGGQQGTPQHQQGVHGGIPGVQASALPLSMSKRQLSLPRPEPCSEGLCLQIRWSLHFTLKNLQSRLSYIYMIAMMQRIVTITTATATVVKIVLLPSARVPITTSPQDSPHK